ncbi:MAG: GSCFA domain-containing protein [Nonlabens sp.]
MKEIALLTRVPIKPSSNQIDYYSQVVLLGSCFTENIGKKLLDCGFNSTINPLGILFNAVSLENIVSRAVNGDCFRSQDLHDGICYEVHSKALGTGNDSTLDVLNKGLEQLGATLKKTTHLYLSLGTSWVYELIGTGQIVANCHKQPQKLFNKRLLSTGENRDAIQSIIKKVTSINPDLQVVLTISPVRHLKDGFIENAHSKARLIDAVHSLTNSHQTTYFPSYEIAMDELRDYRFYSRDLVHLNDLGVDYIWSRFRESEINPNAYNTMKEVLKYRSFANHRSSDPLSHQDKVELKRQELLYRFPFISL